MSGGMNLEQAKEYAKTMTYSQAVSNIKHGKGIEFRKATMIKLRELAEIADRLDRKTEPQTDKWSHDCIGCGNNDTCEFAFTEAVKICRYINDSQTEQVKEVCDRPYLESCDLCWKQFHCRAKDEPQTDCAWK